MRNRNKCIIPECYVDSCLIEVLINAGNDFVNHQKSNGKVAREMSIKFADAFCIGIIDEDKETLNYLNSFIVVKEDEFLKLWQRQDKKQYIIQIRPVVETWILKICKLYNIDLVEQYNLPTDLKSLINVTKSTTSRKDAKLIGLFKNLLEKKCEPVVKLKFWIEFLVENKYNSNLDFL